MTLNTLRVVFFSFFSLAFTSIGIASEDIKEEGKEPFNAKEMIMHHVKDAHEFHIVDLNGNPISIALTIILWTDNGLVTFMSSEFHHDDSGHHVVEKEGLKFVKFHEKIYQLNAGAESVMFDEEHHPTNAGLPMDFSITRNVFMM